MTPVSGGSIRAGAARGLGNQIAKPSSSRLERSGEGVDRMWSGTTETTGSLGTGRRGGEKGYVR